MKICYFGTYESDYPRNRIMIDGLRQQNVDVFECHEPFLDGIPDKIRLLKQPWTLVKLAWRLVQCYARLYRRFRLQAPYDAVIVGYIGQLDMLLAWLLTRQRCPLIFNPLISLHDTLIIDRQIYSSRALASHLLRWLDRLALNAATLVLTDTEISAHHLQTSLKIPASKISTIYVGADDREFFPGPQSPSRSEFRLLFYGKFIPLHGIETILQAAKLLELHPDISLSIVGTGQLLPSMQQLATELELSRVTFTSWVPQTDLTARMVDADLCLGIFGATEKAARVIPNKVFQVLAARRPLITGDSSAVQELLVHREHAWLCPMADPEALRDAVLMLKDDHALRDHLAITGYQLYLRRCTPQAIGSQLKQLMINQGAQSSSAEQVTRHFAPESVR